MRAHVYVSMNFVCLGMFFFFAVLGIQKGPVQFRCQTRFYFVQGMVLKMDGGV